MNFLKKYINKYWKLFCAGVSCLTIEALCDLMQPTIMSKIIDIGVKKRAIIYVERFGILMLLITAVGAIAAVSRNIIASTVSQKFGAELREDLFVKIQSFSFDNINNFEGATLVTRLTNDVTQVQNFANGLMRIFVKAPIVCIGSIIMAVHLNYHMAGVLGITIPMAGILIVLNMKIGFPLFMKVQRSLDKVNSVMREYLTGVRVVKAFNRFNYESERFEKANNELVSVSTTAMKVMSVFSPGISLFVNLGITAVLWIGGNWVSHGKMQVGQIIAFTNYMTQILFSLMMISNVFTMFVRAKASTERIGEVFALENTMKFNEVSNDTSEVFGRVDFENVSFSYEGKNGQAVIKNVSFTCLPGETIGIIGSTGSGKTSLVSLIPRFYDGTSGTIKVDGIDVKDISLKNLREKIAVVPQKNVLFTGTIAENIKWGKENASFEEVIQAAKISEAHDFISTFPEKYDTMLGQGGVNLSGGQKQRVSIARALIKNPEILILDDCTSAVDMVTEAKIRKSLKDYSKRLTSIIIGQRITSVMTADKIIVLDNGEIAGLGKHDELMKECSIYQDIFYSQIGKEGI
ncbi:MAG: ABC transporter ATP-binding protein [Bacillota bacterium]|nr:ABC transporter ATP-binding protein [Bacillota bacterium]